MKPFGIILLASERSGSNLLRTLLGNHSDISAPVAPHLIKMFYPIKHYFSDLHNPFILQYIGNFRVTFLLRNLTNRK